MSYGRAGLNIRNASENELDAVALHLRDAYIEYKDHLPSDAWEDYLADICDVRSRLGESDLIVAETGGELVGTVTLYMQGELLDWPRGWVGVRLLGVPPRHRGKGISRALMEECLERARQAGKSTVGLHTSELMKAARGLYEKMGFTRVPQFDYNPRPDVVIMAYKLDITPAPRH